ncbi:MAG: AAA family ATPase [Acidobacteria bacterium]|nr:AAA family ATPase [Acidobacteriota bacterium]
MKEVTLTNFRCFRGQQRARLAPLTLLLGENSTGKTSFLALVRALWDTAYFQQVPDFKEAPYDLGSFDEIAHYRGGRGGRAPTFTAGFVAAPDVVRRQPRRRASGGDALHFEVTFVRKGTVPVPSKWLFEWEAVAIEDCVLPNGSRDIRFRTTNGRWQWHIPRDLGARLSPRDRSPLALFSFSWLLENLELEPLAGSPPFSAEDKEQLERLSSETDFGSRFLEGPRPFASAPVRSKPRRTYDPSRPGRDPEGETIPMYLSTAFFEDRKSWNALKDALERFGKDAGLFDEISVKPLGKRGSEPFQMHVRKFGRSAKGPLRNLIDVGYGVSQVLPVITELFRDESTPMFLLQQPEVHLHPSAQAALGSLFCQIAGRRRQLVVETHSDHLLDRVRMDVRDGKTKLTPKDVSILFFERENLDVRIHPLNLDGEGNVLDAPPTYRRFFLDETRRSLRL